MTLIFAYLDPGSSSMIIQMLLGGFAAAGVALKLYWTRFKSLLGIKPKEQPVDAGLYSSDGDAPTVSRSTQAADEEQTPVGSSKS